jgi:flagellar FliL protein
MAEEMNTQEEAKPKRSASKLMILAIAVIVLGAGGYGGWSFFMKGKDQEKKEESQASKPNPTNKKDESKIVFPLESFIVNLVENTRLGKRYLKVTMALEVSDEVKKEMVEAHMAELRDTVLLLLSSQSFAEISTMDGKLELKQALLSRINRALGGTVVRKLYFTEFVVQ